MVVAVGQTVAWENGDTVDHTVTFEGGEESSGTIRPGGTWTHRFDRPGVYRYRCTPHPFMKGVVVVR